MNFFKIILPLALFCLVSACSTTTDEKPALRSSSQQLAAWGLKFSPQMEYQIKEHTDSRTQDIQTEYIQASTADGRVLRAQKMLGSQRKQAENFIQDRITQLESIFDPHPDPYFAILTKKTVCPPKFLPVFQKEKREETILHVVKLYANDRLTFGVCNEDAVSHRATIGMIYCPSSGSLFILESFVPMKIFNQQDDAAISSLQCL